MIKEEAKQLALVLTGNELFMFERAYAKDAELGSDKDFVVYKATRTDVMVESTRMMGRLIMPRWTRTIDPKDKGSEFSKNYPDVRNRINIQVPESTYNRVKEFAEKMHLNLTEASLLLIRNYTAVIYENPDMMVPSFLSKTKVKRKEDTRKSVLIKLESEVYDWFTIQAVARGETTGGYIRRRLNKAYTKSTGMEVEE